MKIIGENHQYGVKGLNKICFRILSAPDPDPNPFGSESCKKVWIISNPDLAPNPQHCRDLNLSKGLLDEEEVFLIVMICKFLGLLDLYFFSLIRLTGYNIRGKISLILVVGSDIRDQIWGIPNRKIRVKDKNQGFATSEIG